MITLPKDGWILPLKYICHFLSCVMIYIGGYINIEYFNQKQIIIDKIIKVVYFSIIINYILYKYSLIKVEKKIKIE